MKGYAKMDLLIEKVSTLVVVNYLLSILYVALSVVPDALRFSRRKLKCMLFHC